MKLAAGFFAFVFGVLVFAIGDARAALPKDADAQKALTEAVEKDFLETRFDDAARKLKTAIDGCGANKCTPSVKAKLYAALGSVLASGKKVPDAAKDAFVEALKLDKNAKPNADIASPEADEAFKQAKKQVRGAEATPTPPPTEPEPTPTPRPRKRGQDGDDCDDLHACSAGLDCKAGICASPPNELPPGEGGDTPPADKKEEPQTTARKNWISATYAFDISLFGGTNVCTRQNQKTQSYVCLRQNDTRYDGTPTNNFVDNVLTGFSPSTMLVMLGYERIVATNVGLGARGGYIIGGVNGGGASYLPAHVEGRVSYYVGKHPFVGTGVRPSAFLAGGLGEVDTKVGIHVVEDGKVCGAPKPGNPKSQCTKPSPDGHVEPRYQALDAWRQQGPGFIGGGGALAIAPVENVELNLGLRISVTVPVPSMVLSPEAGFSVGF